MAAPKTSKVQLKRHDGKPMAIIKGNRMNRKARIREIEVVENRQLALELRRKGLSFREIADTMGVSVATASNYVQAELLDLREKTELDASLIRDVELQRCDYMLKSVWQGVSRGDTDSINTAIRIMERRSKLLGLDAPTKTEIDATLTAVTPDQVAKMSDTDILRRLKELTDRLKDNASDFIEAEVVS